MAIVQNKRARLFDVCAILTVIIVLVVDRWTKTLVINNLELYKEVPFPLVGNYLVLKHIRNYGAAFGMLDKGMGSIILAVLISIAVLVVGYMYARTINTATLLYKIIFGLIIGGAVGNLLDRAIYGGYVVDFVWFRIPEIGFSFAIFNVADAAISIGVFLLFLNVLFGGKGKEETTEQVEQKEEIKANATLDN